MEDIKRESSEDRQSLNNMARLSPKNLVEFWNGVVTENTLAAWRSRDGGPKYIKIGGKVAYPMEEILAFEKKHFYQYTGQRV